MPFFSPFPKQWISKDTTSYRSQSKRGKIAIHGTDLVNTNIGYSEVFSSNIWMPQHYTSVLFLRMTENNRLHVIHYRIFWNIVFLWTALLTIATEDKSHKKSWKVHFKFAILYTPFLESLGQLAYPSCTTTLHNVPHLSQNLRAYYDSL